MSRTAPREPGVDFTYYLKEDVKKLKEKRKEREKKANEKKEKIKGFAPLNLGAVYLSRNNLDSSLMYSQRAYEIAMRQKSTFSLSVVFINLGSVQSKMGNPSLAVSYFLKYRIYVWFLCCTDVRHKIEAYGDKYFFHCFILLYSLSIRAVGSIYLVTSDFSPVERTVV